MSDFAVGVILPAAGSSRRFQDPAGPLGLGPPRSKLEEDLGGRPVLQRTVELFNKHPDVLFLIVAGPADDEAFAAFSDRHADKLAMLGAKLCRGGKDHRYQTVANALKLIPETCTHIAVHDAARPCASAELIDRVFNAARGDSGTPYDAVIPGIDVPDTLKRVDPDWVTSTNTDPLAAILGDSPGCSGSGRPIGRWVNQTIPREHTVAVQTPQVFKASSLRHAYAQADLNSTDDAQLIERLGGKVLVVPGEPTNIKVTRPADLPLARAILGFRAPDQRAAHQRF